MRSKLWSSPLWHVSAANWRTPTSKYSVEPINIGKIKTTEMVESRIMPYLWDVRICKREVEAVNEDATIFAWHTMAGSWRKSKVEERIYPIASRSHDYSTRHYHVWTTANNKSTILLPTCTSVIYMPVTCIWSIRLGYPGRRQPKGAFPNVTRILPIGPRASGQIRCRLAVR